MRFSTPNQPLRFMLSFPSFFPTHCSLNFHTVLIFVFLFDDRGANESSSQCSCDRTKRHDPENGANKNEL